MLFRPRYSARYSARYARYARYKCDRSFVLSDTYRCMFRVEHRTLILMFRVEPFLLSNPKLETFRSLHVGKAPLQTKRRNVSTSKRFEDVASRNDTL